jgi:hypothetical protein
MYVSFRAHSPIALAATILVSNPSVLESKTDAKETQVFRTFDHEAS